MKRFAPLLLVALVGIAGFVAARAVRERDRTADASRRAQIASVTVQGALADARAFVASLGSVLEGESRPDERRFVNLSRGTAGSVGLIDSLWVQTVSADERRAYERRLGQPITRLQGSGLDVRFVPAPPAAAYLPATYTSETREELRPGVDVSSWVGLPEAIRNRANVFAVGATPTATLGSVPGSFLLEAADYGALPGYLAVFIPRGRLTRGLDEDPRRVALDLAGHRLEGGLTGAPAASASFSLLDQQWRIATAKAPLTGIQTALPWVALAWPFALALIVWAVSRAILRRRHAQSRFETLAHEQAALRRVATLVAQDAPPRELLTAVTREARALLGASSARLYRYTGPDHVVVLANDAEPGSELEIGTEIDLDGDNLFSIVWRTGRAGRHEGLEHATGRIPTIARSMGLRAVVGAPISVEGRLWGIVIVGFKRPLSDEDESNEARLYAFTELIATAVSNASARGELLASRARIVAAGDEARRRIERNLHDGAQQQLLAIGLDLRRVRGGLPETAREGVEQIERDLETVLEDIRELSRGLHPSLLSRAGLGPALQVLVRRSPIPTELVVKVDERPPPSIETAMYYVVSELLTNAIRYSRASKVTIDVSANGSDHLRATVVDNGVGGAAPGEGSGLVGAADRTDALGGRFVLTSRPGKGTTVFIELPLSQPEGL